MRITLRILRVLDWATQGANIAGTLLVVGLVLIICIDVIGRETIGVPLPGVPEMVSLSIVAIVFLQAPQALRSGRFTRSDGVIDMLHKRTPQFASRLETLFDLIGFGVTATILYAHWPALSRSWVRGDFVGAIGDFTAPTWPVKAMLALGVALLALQFVARILRRYGVGGAA